MIVITKDATQGAFPQDYSYAPEAKGLAKKVLFVTRWLRAHFTLKYMQPGQRHLDIGCGDGYFLKKSPCAEKYGLDMLMGDHLEDKVDLPDNHFDYVTMLAVIEHLEKPKEILAEIGRILKPGGRLIFTTPKHKAEWLIKLYRRGIEEEHVAYFDQHNIHAYLPDNMRLVAYKTFIFGLNQVFCCEKAG